MAVSCDAASLSTAAKCLSCIPREMWGPVELYLLALAAGGSRDPATLLAAAKCFECIPREMEDPVELYLLAGATSSSTDSATLVSLSKCLSCIPPRIQAAVDIYLLATAAGASTDAATLVAAAKCFKCVPVAERSMLRNYLLCQASNAGFGSGGSGAPLTPTLNSLTLNAAGTQITATFTQPSQGNVTGTEVWLSTDGVTYSKVATVASPGTMWTSLGPGAGSVFYVKVRYTTGSVQGSFSNVLNAPDTVVAAWANRVVANGGGALSTAVISATNTFYTGLKSSGFLSKMIALNTCAPGSHYSMRTPLIVGPGSDPWNTTSIQAGAVTASGWFDNPGAVNQSQDTGCKPSTMGWTAASGGFTFYATVNNAANALLSCGATGAGGADPVVGMYHCYSGAAPHSQTSYLYSTANQTSRQLGDILGFISANRTATNAHSDYWANSTNAFQTLSSEVNVAGAPTQANNFMFGGHNDNGTPTVSNRTYGFFALHMGLTSTEAQAFYNLVQPLMSAYGWAV